MVLPVLDWNVLINKRNWVNASGNRLLGVTFNIMTFIRFLQINAKFFPLVLIRFIFFPNQVALR